MKRRLGYLYLHTPDPENLGEYVTYRIAVEIDEDRSHDNEYNEEEADDE